MITLITRSANSVLSDFKATEIYCRCLTTVCLCMKEFKDTEINCRCLTTVCLCMKEALHFFNYLNINLNI